MINILYVVKNMRLSNGVASYVMNYYRKLVGSNINFDFLVINDVGSPYYTEIKKNGSRVYLLPSYKKHPLLVIPFLDRLFSSNHYDVLHCNVLNSGSLVLMLAKKYEIPVRILHCHATQTSDKKWKEIRNKLFCSISLHYANYYFSCSHLAGDYLFRNNKYYLIPNAINTDKYSFNEQYRSQHREVECCEDKLVIMTVGRVTKQKNPKFIVDIVYALCQLKRNFILWWFGNGKLERAVMHYAKKLGVERYIKFWGASDIVNEYYSAADVFILPSLYEGLPVVGIEAQVSALPVLLSDQITKETQVADAVEFLPILDASTWAKHITYYSNFNREKNALSLNLEQYRIEDQSVRLELLYNKLLSCEHNHMTKE